MSVALLARRNPKAQKTLEDWQADLGYPGVSIVKATLDNTTHYIKTMDMETREYMRDYRKSRSSPLRPIRIDDTLFTDTFYATLKSIRGHTCFQQFALKKCLFSVATPMKTESNAYDVYTDFIISVGAPNICVSDEARVYTSKRWKSINRKYCISCRYVVPYHQSSNFAELIGGKMKYALAKLFHQTQHAPYKYWCYGLEFVSFVQTHLSRVKLGGQTPYARLKGVTPDISIFRFPWFAAVWFYAPTLDFPVDRMKPGFFIGIADTVGDGFSYLIIPGQSYEDIPLRFARPITRSIVRLRDMSDEHSPFVREEENGSYDFVNAQGVSLPDSDSSEEVVHDLEAPTLPECVDYTDPTSDIHGELGNITPYSTLADPDPDVETSGTCPPPLAQAESGGETDDNDDNPPYISRSNVDVLEEEVEGNAIDLDPGDRLYDIVADQVNIAHDPDTGSTTDIVGIADHRWNDETLEVLCLYDSGDKEWHPFDLVQADDPTSLAKYISRNDIGNSATEQIIKRWSRVYKRALRRIFKRCIKSNCFRFYSGAYHPTPKTLRSCRIRKARQMKFGDAESLEALARPPEVSSRRASKFEYGIEVPRNWGDVLRLDAESGDRGWQEAAEKEIGALLALGCFDIQDGKKYKPPSAYQYARLHLVYAVKQDLRKKARLVVDGSRVDPGALNTRATVVRGISVRLLDVIAHHWGKSILAGDIGNAFVQSKTKERVFTKLGPEFGENAGKIALIVKALYGLTTSAANFRKAFADFLRSMGFEPIRYDRDVWIKRCPTGNGYDYICTHVDDFKIIADDPSMYIDRISGAFLIKNHGTPNYYLGNDYQFHEVQKMWTYSCQTYEKEAIRKVEDMYHCLKKVRTPLPVSADFHPELDKSPLLELKEHRRFQALIGMLQWLHTIGRPELGPLLATLNRFGTAPRREHLNLAIRSFGYLKFSKDRKIAIDSRPLQFERSCPDYEMLRPDFLEDYPHAIEEVDPNLPEPYGDPLEVVILVDADHGHDLLTRRSLTGLLAYIDSTPVAWSAKRQGCVATSTYAAEFMELKAATEQAMNLRYYLRCLGIPVPNDGSYPTKLFGDNFSVIQSASNPKADLSKKHIALSFHFVREAIAAGIVSPYWLKGEYNLSDILTKQINSADFLNHLDSIYWRPDWHIHNKNKLNNDG